MGNTDLGIIAGQILDSEYNTRHVALISTKSYSLVNKI
jgi:hypothetical protein